MRRRLVSVSVCCCWTRPPWTVSQMLVWWKSPFAAWMEREGNRCERDPLDPFASLLAKKGGEWEREVFERVGGGVRGDTLSLVRRETPVIYQAELHDELLTGVADFLVLTEDGFYSVWDAKLATSAKPEHVLQLCCYADILAKMGVPVAPAARLVLRGSDVEVDLRHYGSAWRRARKRFESFVKKSAAKEPPPRPGPFEAHGRWTGLAKKLLGDDVATVYGVTSLRRRRLRRAGIETASDLAAVDSRSRRRIRGIRPDALERLQTQARLQVEGGGGYVTIGTPPAIPPPHPRDVYFDLEGDPLARLEYLWGLLLDDDDDDEEEYRCFWAHDPETERHVFDSVIREFRERAEAGGRCYHYGAYEVSALRRFDEAAVDHLERQRYFVDLYKIVRRSLIIGEPKYSLKNVEVLYRNEKRTTDVPDAASSVVSYEVYKCTEDARVLQDIQDYNRDDCVSTKQLVDWLRTTFGTTTTTVEKEDDVVYREDEEGWKGYHRRENRPAWRQRREWLDSTPSELADDERCIGFARKVAVRPTRRANEFTFKFPPQQKRIAPGDRVALVTTPRSDTPPTAMTVADISTSTIKVRSQKKDLPSETCCFIPDDFVNPEPLPTAIKRNLDRVDQLPALEAFLAREQPPAGSENDIPALVEAMDGSVLGVQGPPGTGKTHVAAHCIDRLRGRRIAVMAPSHASIEHLLSKVKQKDHDRKILKIGGVGKKAEFDFKPSIAKAAEAIKDESCVVVGATAWALANPLADNLFDYVFVDEAGQVPAANLCAVAACSRNFVLFGDHAQLPAPARGSHPDDSGASCLEYFPSIFLRESRRLHPSLCGAISELFYDGRLEAHPSTWDRCLDPGGSLITAPAGVVVADVDQTTANSSEEMTTANRAEARAVATLAADVLKRSIRGRPLTPSDILVVAPYNAHVRAIESALLAKNLATVRVGTVDKFQGQEAPVVIASLCVSGGGASDTEDDEDYPRRALSFVLDARRLNVALSRAQCLAVLVASPQIADAPAPTLDKMRQIARFSRIRELAVQVIAVDPRQ
ncbi:hypothetical protein CTAYLR_000537 [Chrysophaeum taylorii]|uniref:Uncharacterized protein n=1 Tax=Chrysophaeum taylorii TaxID=2483200 RepID=A0AAD7XMB3_9STRA|nr:hypothetical protein CTAYLR_000537 [Chrysophaeum taylorii]